MESLIAKLKKILFPQRESTLTENKPEIPLSGEEQTAVLTDEVISKLMRDLASTREDMYSCHESAALLDEYVEMVNNREDATRLMPLVKAHLDICSGCTEKYTILLQILESEELEA